MAESTLNYRKRIADILLEEKLEAMGAVLIEVNPESWTQLKGSNEKGI